MTAVIDSKRSEAHISVNDFKKNSKVCWKWLGRDVLGVVEDVFFESVTREIKGKKITRHGSKDKPAYLVKSEAGNLALKLKSELKPQEKKKTTKSKLFSA